MKKELTDWYKKINEEDISSSGAIKIHLPIINTDVAISTSKMPDDTETLNAIKLENDPVILKDRTTCMKAYYLSGMIQTTLLSLIRLQSPYELESLERIKLTTLVKDSYLSLGEAIALL